MQTPSIPQRTILVKSRKDVSMLAVKDYTGKRWINEIRSLSQKP